MGSGTNRAFWAENGTRTARRQGTQGVKHKGSVAFLKRRRLRAEARRRASA